jgi:hypothetical protein
MIFAAPFCHFWYYAAEEHLYKQVVFKLRKTELSRSHRHTPIAGHANAKSERYDKQSAAQRERKWVHDHLNAQAATTLGFGLVDYDEHPLSGGWTFAKDGKSWMGSVSEADAKIAG